MLLEVIVQSVSDAREAARGGAGRLEVVRSIGDGGLTPSMALVRAIAGETSLPLRVIVRENPGFATDAREKPALRAAIDDLTRIGVDGIVIGFARDAELLLNDLNDVLDHFGGTPPLPVTFHRAFDSLRDPLRAIPQLAAISRIDRILTSGGSGPAHARAQMLRAYADQAGPTIAILAGGGVDREMLTTIARTRCVSEVHVGRAAREHDDPEGPVSADRVRRLAAALSDSV